MESATAKSEVATTNIEGREEACGPGWQEHFVDAKRASDTVSVGSSVSKSFSYVTIDNFASLEERDALIQSATSTSTQMMMRQEESEDDSTSNGNGNSNHVLFASSANVGCSRFSVETLLDAGAKVTSITFLDRLLSFLDGTSGSGRGGTSDNRGDDPDFASEGGGERMANLAEEVFGRSLDLRSMEAVWYSEPDECGKDHPEPKVNLYAEGGYFAQHSDNMELTLLVVLSDRFEGGGTAFFRDLDLTQADLDLVGYDSDGERKTMTNDWHSLLPERIAKPRAGAAMIWGGTLQHMALPITDGSRAVFVGSFDLK